MDEQISFMDGSGIHAMDGRVIGGCHPWMEKPHPWMPFMDEDDR